MSKRKRQKVQRCEPLDRYLEIHGLNIRELADRLEMPATTVRSWVNGWRPIAAENAVRIEHAIGVPRETLRPDIFVKRAA